MQRIGNGPSFFMPYGVSLIRWQIFCLPFDHVQLTDIFEGLCSKGTLVGFVQVVELASRMGHAANLSDAAAKTSLVT